MIYLIKIAEQSLMIDAPQDPDNFRVRLGDLNYTPVEVPNYKPGQELVTKDMGDVVLFIGPTPDGRKAVGSYRTAFAGTHYAEFGWDQLEPWEQKQKGATA